MPGITARPFSPMTSLSLALSLSCSMLSGVGPMNTRPFFRHRAAKWAFSDRNPYPGWMAWAPETRAAEITRSSLR